MGRMLEALKHGEGTRLAFKDKPFFEDSLERDPHPESLPTPDDSIPFIEVGPHKKLEGSASVMAAPGIVPLVKPTPQPRAHVPHHASHPAPEKKPTILPIKADLLQTKPLSVAFEPWPSAPRLAQSIAQEIIAYHHPDHPVSQQYASLIEKMLESANTGHAHALLLVGSKPHVGTSTVLLNLAVAAAQHSKHRVVVIDAHLRRPGLAQRLGFSQSIGLQDVFQGKLALEQAVLPTPVANLHLVPAQMTNSPPALSAEAVRWFFTWLRDRFDLLLVDGPALDTGGELAALAPLCDGVYLVLPQGENPQMQRTFAHTLTTMGARLRGLIHTQPEL
jgi:Mrp family chromosome partitioning ATPase